MRSGDPRDGAGKDARRAPGEPPKGIRDAAAYQEFLNEFIARKLNVFARAALARARAVPGVEIDDSGRVTRFAAEPFASVEAVLRTFERLTGDSSNLTVWASLRSLRLLERYPGLELPGVDR